MPIFFLHIIKSNNKHRLRICNSHKLKSLTVLEQNGLQEFTFSSESPTKALPKLNSFGQFGCKTEPA